MAKATWNKKVNSKLPPTPKADLKTAEKNASVIDWKAKYYEEVRLHVESLKDLNNVREKLEAIKRGDLQTEKESKILH